MAGKRPFFTLGLGQAIIVSPAALGTVELRVLSEALAEIGSNWTAELQDVCVSGPSLVVVPDDGDDMTGPSFMLSREAFGYRIDQVHWDQVTEVGQFPAFADAVWTIRQRIGMRITNMAPSTITRH